MNSSIFSENLVQFIGRYIEAVETLEILLLLREHRARTWSAQEVNDSLRSSLASVTHRLDDLAGYQLLARSERGFRYEPDSPRLAALVDELAVAYRDRRHRVIELIFSKPTREIHSFSNAFKIKREDNDG